MIVIVSNDKDDEDEMLAGFLSSHLVSEMDPFQNKTGLMQRVLE